MSSPSSFYTTASALMHACLAYVSPELQTLDAIIRLPRRANTRFSYCPLPPEVLLIIRSHLVPIMTSHLLAASEQALVRYEYSLRALLCSQCIEYNEEIYGPSVWQWEQFSGPCGCSAIGTDVNSIASAQSTTSCFLPNPTQFRDAHHWLEHHLSQSISPPTALSTIRIWDLVTDVLRGYDCEVIQHKPNTHRHFASLRWDYGFGHYTRGNDTLSGYVLIIPATKVADDGAQMNTMVWYEDRCQRERINLHRMGRDLGIPLFSSVDLGMDLQLTSLSPRPRPLSMHLASPSSKLRPKTSSDSLKPSALLLELVSSAVAVVFSIPITVFTMFATIICYYVRPGGLRVF